MVEGEGEVGDGGMAALRAADGDDVARRVFLAVEHQGGLLREERAKVTTHVVVVGRLVGVQDVDEAAVELLGQCQQLANQR